MQAVDQVVERNKNILFVIGVLGSIFGMILVFLRLGFSQFLLSIILLVGMGF